jgi:cysteine desulfurase
LLHTDATQAFGKIQIDVLDLGVDFLSASGHKIYGPKGVGILFFKKEHRKLLQIKDSNREVEFGVRSGTIPVPLCVGMGMASHIASLEMSDDLSRISILRDRLIRGITSQLEEIHINGSLENSYPGITNISFRGCEGEALMMESPRICVSSGSACTSNKLSISHVLASMGITPDIAQSSIRISLGKYTSENEVDIALEDLVNATNKLRDMSPVWEMIKSEIDIESIFEGSSCRR